MDEVNDRYTWTVLLEPAPAGNGGFQYIWFRAEPEVWVDDSGRVGIEGTDGIGRKVRMFVSQDVTVTVFGTPA